MRRFFMPHCLRVVRYMFTLRICLCPQGKLHSGVGTVRTVGLIISGLHCLFSVLQRHTMVSLVFPSHPIVDGLRHTQTSTIPCVLCVCSRSCARTRSSESFQLPASSCISCGVSHKEIPMQMAHQNSALLFALSQCLIHFV